MLGTNTIVPHKQIQIWGSTSLVNLLLLSIKFPFPCKGQPCRIHLTMYPGPVVETVWKFPGVPFTNID